MASDIDEQLRAEVAQRANCRCEYCLLHEDHSGFPHQLAHIVSRKHGGTSSSANFAYSCLLCNRYKGSDVATIDPVSGEAIRLFHPRQDLWRDHFRYANGVIEPLTRIGSATVRILRMNTTERVAERVLIQNLR